MRAAATLLCLAALALPGLAQDPLKSEACGQGLASLQSARAQGQSPAQLEALRQRATQDCLGGTGAPHRPSPTLREPDLVPPPTLEPATPPPAPVAPPAPAPLKVDRPAIITSCDAGGCWDSDGRRLNRAGPLLIGPGGTCVQSGTAVQCP